MLTAITDQTLQPDPRSALDNDSVACLMVLDAEAELRRGLERSEFELHFQPKYCLNTESLVGYEGLLRWRHPRLGLLTPGSFLEEARAFQMMPSITNRVLELAFETVRSWSSEVGLAINLDAEDVIAADMAERIRRTAHAFGCEPDAVMYEISERTVVDPSSTVVDRINALAGLGALSLDDFGSGATSLAHVGRLRLSQLKLDRSIVAGIAGCPRQRVIVRAVVEMAHDLGLSVVAEGIEDEDVLLAARIAGCDQAQGFHLGRPVPGFALGGSRAIL